MNDETINRAIDLVAAGAGKVEQAVIDMAPHVWGAEVAYWRVQGIMALAASAVVVTAEICLLVKVARIKRAAVAALALATADYERAKAGYEARAHAAQEARQPFYDNCPRRPTLDDVMDRGAMGAWRTASAVTGVLGFLFICMLCGDVGAAAFAPEMYAIRDLLEIVK